MFFIAILFLTTLSIAGTAAFFSVYGLAQLFQGMTTSVLIMGASLEAGKLVAASFLYRYWTKIGWLLKTYLISAVLMLMVITSIGIFGMLSLGYQTDSIPLKQIESHIALLNQERTELIKRKNEIDQQIASLPANMVSGRQRLMKTFSSELKTINERIPVITAEVQKLNTQMITTQAHVGPIVYIAKVFGSEVDDATKYIILMIIIVFDPLAVALTLGVNVALRIREDEKKLALVPADEVVPDVSTPIPSQPTLTPDEIRLLVDEEVKHAVNNLPPSSNEPDAHVLQLARRNKAVSNLRLQPDL